MQARQNGKSIKFQSPPHRGIRCDRARTVVLARARALNFSPLLIGEFGVTWHGQDLLRGRGHFSPLLIGEFGVTPSGRRNGSSFVYFSPLLIGEFGVTPCPSFSAAGNREFQSPPHRGIRCDLCAVSACGAPRVPYFSPLLIGEFGVTSKPVHAYRILS